MDWREEGVLVRPLGLEGRWIVRSHIKMKSTGEAAGPRKEVDCEISYRDEMKHFS